MHHYRPAHLAFLFIGFVNFKVIFLFFMDFSFFLSKSNIGSKVKEEQSYCVATSVLQTARTRLLRLA